MLVERQPEELLNWFVVFWPDSPALNRWTRWVPGRFKHVSAFAHSPLCLTWLWYDVSLNGTKLIVLPDTERSRTVLGHWTGGCHVVHLAACEHASMRARLGLFCTSAVRHLLGVPGGALLPDGLLRDCLRHGAKVIVDAGPEGPARSNPDCGGTILGGGERPADSIEP